MRSVATLIVVLLLSFVACQPKGGQDQRVLTIDSYVKGLRNSGLHGIRPESNKRMGEALQAKAADIYIGTQRVMAVELPPGRYAAAVTQYFEGYEKQGYRVIPRENMVIVAREDSDEKVFDVFERLY